MNNQDMLIRYSNISETLDHVVAVFEFLCLHKPKPKDVKYYIERLNSLLPDIRANGYSSTLWSTGNVFWLSVTSTIARDPKITLRFRNDYDENDELRYEWEVSFKDGISYDH